MPHRAHGDPVRRASSEAAPPIGLQLLTQQYGVNHRAFACVGSWSAWHRRHRGSLWLSSMADVAGSCFEKAKLQRALSADPLWFVDQRLMGVIDAVQVFRLDSDHGQHCRGHPATYGAVKIAERRGASNRLVHRLLGLKPGPGMLADGHVPGPNPLRGGSVYMFGVHALVRRRVHDELRVRWDADANATRTRQPRQLLPN